MKTLNYTHLEEKGANTIVLSLQQLLADFQIHYANLTKDSSAFPHMSHETNHSNMSHS